MVGRGHVFMFSHLWAHPESSVRVNSRWIKWLSDGEEAEPSILPQGGSLEAKEQGSHSPWALPSLPWGTGWTLGHTYPRPASGTLPHLPPHQKARLNGAEAASPHPLEAALAP